MQDLELFKRRVGYQVKADQDTVIGDGTARVFELRCENVFEVTIYADGNELDPTSYVVDGQPGTITFTDAPINGTTLTIAYKFAPFTDAEAQALIDQFGLTKAVIEALRSILADVSRRTNYRRGDTEVSDSDVFKHVRELVKMYEDELQQNEAVEAGGIHAVQRMKPRCEYQPNDLSRLYGQY